MKKNLSFLPLFLFLICSTAFAQPDFHNELPLPYLLGAPVIRVTAHESFHKFDPGDTSNYTLNGNPTTQPDGISTYTYNQKDSVNAPGRMTFLGPTMIWRTPDENNDSIRIRVTNQLPDTTTSHWHGAEVPAAMDGGPHQMIPPNDTWPVSFVDLDRSSTLWYHPHVHGKTFEQVSLGLSGMIISRQETDPIDDFLPTRYGADDFPIILSDIGFDTDSLGISSIKTGSGGGRKYNIVNGVTSPYLEVPSSFIRLRVLNGSTRKGIFFGFSPNYAKESIIPFTLIATDGGFTINTDTLPDKMKTLRTAPGTRNEIILDLNPFSPGDTLYLTNRNDLMPNSVPGSAAGNDPTEGNAFLQIRVVHDSVFPGFIPRDTLYPFTSDWDEGVSDTLNVTRRRTKRFMGSSGTGFSIDGLPYDMGFINDTVCVGAKEIWTIINQSNKAHPFHIHKLFFRVLDVQDTTTGEYVPLSQLGLNGPKDDVMVLPGWKVRFLAKFDNYPNAITPNLSYMYHCHILSHEDLHHMMHQFVVTDESPCEPVVSLEEDKLSENAFSVYPNPTSGQIFLRGHSGEKSVVRILDLRGREIHIQQLPAIDKTIPLEIGELPTGMYLIEWTATHGRFTHKVMVK